MSRLEKKLLQVKLQVNTSAIQQSKCNHFTRTRARTAHCSFLWCKVQRCSSVYNAMEAGNVLQSLWVQAVPTTIVHPSAVLLRRLPTQEPRHKLHVQEHILEQGATCREQARASSWELLQYSCASSWQERMHIHHNGNDQDSSDIISLWFML